MSNNCHEIGEARVPLIMSTYKLSLCYEKEQKEGGEGVGNNEEKEARMAERRNEI